MSLLAWFGLAERLPNLTAVIQSHPRKCYYIAAKHVMEPTIGTKIILGTSLMNENIEFPQYAWINCRETFEESLELGEVVIPEVNILKRPGSPPISGNVVGKVSHGTKVSILDRSLEEYNTNYYRISIGDVDGWISENFLSWNWSSFTFIGNFKPRDACKNLEVNNNDMGITLLIRESGFAVITEGDPAHFEIINKAVIRFINRIINALAPLTTTSLDADFVNWVEVPIGNDLAKGEVVGFLGLENREMKTISNDNVDNAQSVIPLMKLSPYFDLALSDFNQALKYPQHAPIFLSRAIESVENHFAWMAKGVKGKGKEAIMCEMLKVNKGDVEYITKRANASHRRHASPDATNKLLSNEELDECFHKTSNILAAFAGYLGATIKHDGT